MRHWQNLFCMDRMSVKNNSETKLKLKYMNTKRALACMIFLFLLAFTGCREKFDDHYNSVGDASIGMSVTQVLENKGDFNLFIRMIRRADLERTLSESGLYTCFAPKDEHVQAYLDQNGWTVESMPEDKLIYFINYHFMSGMKYLYDFEKNYEGYKENGDYDIEWAMNVTNSTRGDDYHPAKYLRVFTPSYFAARAHDYTLITGVQNPGDFMVENARVSETDRDIPTSNGVVHVLDESLTLLPRADEAMANDPELTLFMRFFDRFVEYESRGMNSSGQVDTTKIKHYNVKITKTAPRVLDIADERNPFVIFAPTDDAIKAELDKYITPGQLVSYDSIPDQLVIDILQTLTKNTSVCWGISDITRDDPYFFSYSGTILQQGNDMAALYKEPLQSSNAVIYKVNKLPRIPNLESVEGGLYVYKNKFREWGKMIDNGYLGYLGVTDVTSYQHPPKTILVQPDDSKAWIDPTGNGFNGIDGFENNYLDTLGWRMRTGVLEANVEDGQFEHRYYQTSFGFILYEDGNFIDYKNNKIPLLSETPVWTGVNGSIYEIDGIFEALLNLTSTDSTEYMYRSFIKDDPQFSTFKLLIEKADQKTLLDSWKSTYYTVFAPTNEAFEASREYTQNKINQMTAQEARDLLWRHIVANRRIFTDGQTSGPIASMSNTILNLSGAWDDFSVRTQYGGTTVIKELANRQGSNGVFHGVTTVITQ